jgi:hypothetical protein
MHIDTFLARWRTAGGSERANYQLFIADLCALLASTNLSPPVKTRGTTPTSSKRRIVFHHGDGSTSNGIIDATKRRLLHRRGQENPRRFRNPPVRPTPCCARGQAENYARTCPL